jgi:hypothetical protein
MTLAKQSGNKCHESKAHATRKIHCKKPTNPRAYSNPHELSDLKQVCST